MKLRVLFSDIDGTLCHYNLKKYASVGDKDAASGLWPCTSLDGRTATRLLKLPPSTTGKEEWPDGACGTAVAACVMLTPPSGLRKLTQTAVPRASLLPHACWNLPTEPAPIRTNRRCLEGLT